MKKKGLRFTAAWGRRRSRSTAASSSGAASRSKRSAAGRGLVESLTQIAKKSGIEIWYQARAVSLIADDSGFHVSW